MKILYLCHRIPYPPNKGDKIRSYHQVSHLARGHSVHLACLVDDADDLPYAASLEPICASVDAVYQRRDLFRLLANMAFLGRKPLSVASFHSRELERRIHRRLGSGGIDAIWIFSSAMAQYVPPGCGIPTIVDFVDADSEKWRAYAERSAPPLSWIYRLEAEQLARFEAKVGRASDHAIFVSQTEADFVKDALGGGLVSVVPNGVDLDYFRPEPNGVAGGETPIIAFVGVMNYRPNVDAVSHFCDAIFPLVQKCLPQVQFWIVGRSPTRRVRALARRSHVTVTGSVPDVRPYLKQASLSVAPFRIARGVQNKVLESMAMGIPVVGTKSAFQGIQATEMDGVRIVDEPAAFAEQVVGLLGDPAVRATCSKQARCFVEHHHRWEEHGAALSSILIQATRKTPEEVDHVRDCRRR